MKALFNDFHTMRKIFLIVLFIIASITLSGCALFEKEDAPMEGKSTDFTVTSPAFADKDIIPLKYAKASPEGGENVSIPLTWENAPANTVSFALTMVDTSPGAGSFVHWLIGDIPSNVSSLVEGASLNLDGKEFMNDYGEIGYGGPFPPPGISHTYEITVYALKDVASLNLEADAELDNFYEAITDHIIAQDTVVGYFSR